MVTCNSCVDNNVLVLNKCVYMYLLQVIFKHCEQDGHIHLNVLILFTCLNLRTAKKQCVDNMSFYFLKYNTYLVACKHKVEKTNKTCKHYCACAT